MEKQALHAQRFTPNALGNAGLWLSSYEQKRLFPFT
jgi:hypothetical protein